MNYSRSPDPACQALLKRYGPQARLSTIPWKELPICLQKTCEHFLKRWWDDIDIDQTIEASGLSDMILVELLAYHEEGNQPGVLHVGRRYRLAAFIRVEPEGEEPVSYAEIRAEKEQQELMYPENIYRIEEIEPATPVH